MLHGFCIKCGRVKRVRVIQPPIGRIAIGVCQNCEKR